MALVPSVSAKESPKHTISWWKTQYGEVAANDDPLVRRAEKIFERVKSAADKNGRRVPKLAIIKAKGDPYAAAIKDGGIILTHGGLKLCYANVREEKGDSRLAFVLGHELSHQAKDDFWHSAAFLAVKEFTSDSAIKQALLGYLNRTTDTGSGMSAREVAKRKELEADAYGMLYMTMAGYDPKMVVDRDGTNFFKEWVSQITGNVAYYDPDHPGPEERAEFVRAQLAAVAEDLSLFTFGVHLYQTGNYEAAIAFLDKFREKFPSREVFNNIGLSYYQIAAAALSSCDKSLLLKFKLSTVLDTDTLANRFLTRAAGISDPSSCYQDEKFLRAIGNSIEYLSMAVEKDPLYVPAKINLSSAYIMMRKYTKAKIVLDDVLDIEPDNHRALNNKAVADYMDGIKLKKDVANNSIAALRSIIKKHPGFTDALYNIASIQAEKELKVDEKKSWQSFLKEEPVGPYAAEAKKRLGLRQNAKKMPRSKSAPESPVKIGDIGRDTSKILKNMKMRALSIGDNAYEIYNDKAINVLVINGSVEVVIVEQDTVQDLLHFEALYGKPERVIENIANRTLMYRSFAADIIDGKVKQLIYYERQGI
jgi:tetratricopeptide (TPR) repeat protein